MDGTNSSVFRHCILFTETDNNVEVESANNLWVRADCFQLKTGTLHGEKTDGRFCFVFFLFWSSATKGQLICQYLSDLMKVEKSNNPNLWYTPEYILDANDWNKSIAKLNHFLDFLTNYPAYRKQDENIDSVNWKMKFLWALQVSNRVKLYMCWIYILFSRARLSCLLGRICFYFPRLFGTSAACVVAFTIRFSHVSRMTFDFITHQRRQCVLLWAIVMCNLCFSKNPMNI